jgi:hypothetical protein
MIIIESTDICQKRKKEKYNLSAIFTLLSEGSFENHAFNDKCF